MLTFCLLATLAPSPPDYHLPDLDAYRQAQDIHFAAVQEEWIMRNHVHPEQVLSKEERQILTCLGASVYDCRQVGLRALRRLPRDRQIVLLAWGRCSLDPETAAVSRQILAEGDRCPGCHGTGECPTCGADPRTWCRDCQGREYCVQCRGTGSCLPWTTWYDLRDGDTHLVHADLFDPTLFAGLPLPPPLPR